MTGLPDERLITKPLWRKEDLGAPLPDSAHANSVCLPMWQDVVDYEEKNPRVIKRLRAGYPRFVVPALCAKLFDQCREKFATDGELCHAYPTERAARRCIALIERWSDHKARVVKWPEHQLYVVCFPPASEVAALKYWRHSGDGLSSLQAGHILAGKPAATDTLVARRLVRQRIASLAGVPEDSVYLFKSGMAAIYTLHRMVTRANPDGACVQFGFPYVDTLKIQQDFGFRSTFFPIGTADDIKMLSRIMSIDAVSGIFCEFPSNPLLNSPDLSALSALARRHQVPLVVDDTIASWLNVNLLEVADVVVTSLTKIFTGRGDVMGGAVIINPRSPRITELREAMRAEYEDATWVEMLRKMEEQSRDMTGRVRQINQTTEQVCAWLKDRPEIDQLYYPKYLARDIYDRYRQPEGGYGGLFSIVLKHAADKTPAFYNALEISKGPNLGTTFSLCCPFTLLAHYNELDWAEQCGVSRYLLRFSIGLESAQELIARLERAFAAIK